MKESNQTEKKHTIIDHIRRYFSDLEMPPEKTSIEYILNININQGASLTREDVAQFFDEKNATRAVNTEPGQIIPDSTNNKCIKIKREEFINSIMEHNEKEPVIYLIDLLADKDLLKGKDAKNIFKKIVGTEPIHTAIRHSLLLLQKTDLFKNKDNIITIINDTNHEIGNELLTIMHAAKLFNTDNRQTANAYFNLVCGKELYSKNFRKIVLIMHRNGLLNQENVDRLPPLESGASIITLSMLMGNLEELKRCHHENFKFLTDTTNLYRFTIINSQIELYKKKQANINPTQKSSSDDVEVRARQPRQPSISKPVAGTSRFFSTRQSEQEEDTNYKRKKPRM